MTESQSGAVGDHQAAVGQDAMPLKVFINYRHEDTEEAALRLYDRLSAHFDPENVFLDVKSLEPGTKWLEEIKAHGARGSAFLALVGRTWLASLKDRERRTAGEPEDFVALELELALRRWPGKVIPVLVGRAIMPDVVKLPKPIKALAGIQAMPLRPASFDEDVEQLIAKIDAIASEPDSDRGQVEGATIDGTVEVAGATAMAGHRPEDIPPERSTMPGPDSAHYETMLRYMIKQGSVVPILGSGVHGSLPDANQLATHLAQSFGLNSESLDLAEIAQRVAVAEGPAFLHKAIKEVLTPEPEPNDVHRFLARFPKRLEELGLPARYQMIVTTNYDTALERAFEAEGEPYDLAVFLASGTDKGKFVHVPWKDDPRLINEVTKYREFPIHKDDELERTVIVKIHGAAQGGEGDYSWDESYVLTEDQYIDYLVTDQIVSVIPHQILNKLTSSHCLFLGYAMHDWSPRVFLKRIWQGRPLENKSWAIEREPDALEKDSWNSLQVELLAASPDDYANELDARITEWRASGA